MKKGKRKTSLDRIDGNRIGHVKTPYDVALKAKAEHDALIEEYKKKGGKRIFVKHPTASNCKIVKWVKDIASLIEEITIMDDPFEEITKEQIGKAKIWFEKLRNDPLNTPLNTTKAAKALRKVIKQIKKDEKN